MKKKRKLGRKLLGFLLTLVMVLGMFTGIVPGVRVTVNAENSYNFKELTLADLNGKSDFNEVFNALGGLVSYSYPDYKSLPAPSSDSYVRLIIGISNNPDYLRVNIYNNGTIVNAGTSVSLNNGSIKIRDSMNDGIKYYYIAPVSVNSVSLNKSSTTLTAGKTEMLTAAVLPDNATDKYVTWSSNSDALKLYADSSCTVPLGTTTGVAAGQPIYAKGISLGGATVTATSRSNNDVTASCDVTVISNTYNVTYKVVNGTWSDGSTADKTETVASGGNPTSVPTGMRANSGYTGGSWDTDPSTATISADTTFTYTFTQQQSISQTVTFKVVNGSWDDGTTADKIVTLTGNEGDTLKLSADQIPAVGTKPNDGYKAGSWDVTPSTDTAISSNVTYTYTYEADSSGGSSDSGSGDSSGGSSDSGSSDSSGGTSSDSSDNTNTNTDTSAKVPYDDVPISTGSVNDITGTASATAESNPFGTKIENSSNLTTLLSLTDAEVAQGVNVWLDIQDMSASVSKTDKSLIQDKSGDYTVGLYLDINLFKKVGSNDATKVTETNGKVKASIVIPESLWKSGRTFEIIRVHDGVATAIAGTYDENTHVFTFETDKFSTYALTYKDSASSSDSGTTSDSSSSSDSGSSNSSNSTQSTAPKTGDPNDIRVWYLLLIASLGGLGFLGLSKKKEN